MKKQEARKAFEANATTARAWLKLSRMGKDPACKREDILQAMYYAGRASLAASVLYLEYNSRAERVELNGLLNNIEEEAAAV